MPVSLSIQFANKLLSERLLGSVINFSSVVANGNPGQITYASSKSAIESATKTLSLEFSNTGIRFNCIAPGFIGVPSTLKSMSKNKLENIIFSTPLRKLGDAQSVAQLAESLISNKFCNGSTYRVDGGLVI